MHWPDITGKTRVSTASALQTVDELIRAKNDTDRLAILGTDLNDTTLVWTSYRASSLSQAW